MAFVCRRSGSLFGVRNIEALGWSAGVSGAGRCGRAAVEPSRGGSRVKTPDYSFVLSYFNNFKSSWGPLAWFEKHWNSSGFTEGLSSPRRSLSSPRLELVLLMSCVDAFITVIIQEDNKNVSVGFCSEQMLSSLRCPSEDVWCFTVAVCFVTRPTGLLLLWSPLYCFLIINTEYLQSREKQDGMNSCHGTEYFICYHEILLFFPIVCVNNSLYDVLSQVRSALYSYI